MNIGRTTNVGMLLFAKLYFPIIYAKYARVNVKILILRGNLESGPFLVSVRLLQIIFGFDETGSSGNAVPIEMVMKQFSNNIPRNMMPFISELKREESAKKLIKINGANLNPIYIIDCTFNTLIILSSRSYYKNTLYLLRNDRFCVAKSLSILKQSKQID